MNPESDPQISKAVHHGRNVKRFREMQGIKQETLAENLGVSQQTISRFEAQEILEDEMLDKMAKVLHVTVDAIKKCDDDNAVNIISNTFNEQSIAYQSNFNPINKIVTLYDEKMALYERLLKAEQSKNEFLEKLLTELVCISCRGWRQ